MLYSESSIQIFLVRGHYMCNEMDGLQSKKMNLVLHYHANTTLPLPAILTSTYL